jgi:hypothetical protein
VKEGRYNAEMNLKFICSEDFGIAEEIYLKVQGYLPNLISKIEIIGSDAFKGIFETWEIVPMVRGLLSRTGKAILSWLLFRVHCISPTLSCLKR